MLDILIINGHVVDTTTNTDGYFDIGIQGGRIVEVDPAKPRPKAKHTVNAEGCLVFPGLIDYHAHFYENITELGVIPDACFLPNGVTSAVDGGSAGCANFEAFVQDIVSRSHVKAKAYINCVSAGMSTLSYYENIDATKFNQGKIQRLFNKYPDLLLGIKVRIQKEMIRPYGIEGLVRTLEIAEAVGTRVCVHTTNPVELSESVVEMLRPGDIFCHVYHGTGSNLLNENGKIRPEFIRARERGVLFDAANGKMNWAITTAKRAIAEGFLPDIISTDLTTMTMYTHPVKGLPYIMSKYLCLGLSLHEVLSRVTTTPAALMNMQGRIGTLSPGAYGDVSIFKLKEKPITYYDTLGKSMQGNMILVPQMTISDGVVVYAQLDFEN